MTAAGAPEARAAGRLREIAAELQSVGRITGNAWWTVDELDDGTVLLHSEAEWFAALSPDYVLALLDELAALQARADELERERENLKPLLVECAAARTALREIVDDTGEYR